MRRRHLILLASSALLILGMAAPAGAQTTSPLVGQWHFDEDLPRNPENPESIRYTPDSSGGGRDFDWGLNSSLLGDGRWSSGYDAANSSPPILTGPGANLQRVTLMAWVRTGTVEPTPNIIAGRGTGGLTCQEMPYSLRQGGDSPAGVLFAIRGPGGSAVTSPTSLPINDNQWHMLAGTFDGSTVRLYLDGEQVDAGTPAGTSTIGYGAGGGNFGVDGYQGSGCANGDFSGAIDELRVYDRALTGAEISRLAGPPNLTEPPSSPPPSVPPTPPDRDTDGVADAGDNCPDAFNPTQLDRDRDGRGAACDPVAARLSVGPLPTCVGNQVQFNGVGSTSDSPITDYHVTYAEPRDAGGFSTRDVGDGPAPLKTFAFDWSTPPRPPTVITNNNAQTFSAALNNLTFPTTLAILQNPGRRRDVDATLTITTAAGELARDTKRVTFAQKTSDDSRAGCVSARTDSLPFRVAALGTPVAATNRVSVPTTCTTRYACGGAIVLSTAAARPLARLGSAGAAQRRKRARPRTILATKSFTIPAGQTRRVSATLNKRGRRLLSRQRRLRVKASVVTFAQLGNRAGVGVKNVTLKAKPRKKARPRAKRR